MPSVFNNLTGVCGTLVWSLRVSLHLGGVSPTNGTRPVGPKPLVDALPMELVAAGQDSQQLAGLKITHAHYTQCLLRLMVIRIEAVRRKLFDVSLCQSSEFGFSQTLSKVQEGLIIFHFSIVNIQLQTDRRTCGLNWQH